jgi:hypothetical protein
MRKKNVSASALLLLSVVLGWRPMAAQQSQPASADKSAAAGNDQSAAGNSTEALQKATQNPVANLISVPVQK